jgi:hypothetical protein
MYDIQDIVDSYGEYDDEAYEAFGNIDVDYADQISGCSGNRLPWWRDDERALPNGVLHSALFGVVKKGKRGNLKDQTICASKNVKIMYSGERLDQADLDVWEQCIHLGRSIAVNSPIFFSGGEFLKAIGKGTGKSQYVWLDRVFNRLMLSMMIIETEKIKYKGQLVNGFWWDKKRKKFKIRLNPELTELFGKYMYTKINHQKKLEVAKEKSPLLIWMFRFYSSHKKPFPMYVETLKDLCGSENSLKSFKYQLKKALEKLSMLTGWTCWIDKSGKVYVQKTKQIESSYNPKKHTNQSETSDFEVGDPSPF